MKKNQKPIEEPQINSNETMFNDCLTQAINNQGTSCFWDGGDWADRWDLQRKFTFYYYDDVPQSHGYKSNVKSPEIVGREQSTLQKLSKFNLSWILRPKKKGMDFTLRLNQLVMDEMFRRGQFRYRLKDAYMDSTTNGTAMVGVDWVTEKRDVQILKSNPSEMSEEEKKEFKDKGIVPMKKATMIDFDGVKLTNYRLENVLVDPAAQNFNTGNSKAGYAFTTELMTKDRFDATLGKNKNFKNLSDVIPASSSDSSDNVQGDNDEFLETPKGEEGDYVKVVRGYFYFQDLYMIRANGVFIYEGPLPYNDKRIPIVPLRACKAPYQLYGIGLPDWLIPIVTQIELISNTVYDYIIYVTNPMMQVSRVDYPEISRKFELSNGEPGTLLPVADTTRGISAIKFPPLTMDVFNSLNMLQRDAVIATQQDPTRLGVVNKSTTATANILNKEIEEAYVAGLIDNFEEDMQQMGEMVLSRIHQFMTDKQAVKTAGMEDEAAELEYYTVEIPGKEINIDWDTLSIEEKDDENATGFVEIRPEMFSRKTEENVINEKGENVKKITKYEVTPSDFDVALNTENVSITSRAMEQQAAGEMLAQLSGFMVDTTNPGKVAAHPMPLVDAGILMREVFDKKNWNKKMLLQYSKLEEGSIDRAKAQNFEAFTGIQPMGHPGESKEHIFIHTQFQQELSNRFETMINEIANLVSRGGKPSPQQMLEFDSTKDRKSVV